MLLAPLVGCFISGALSLALTMLLYQVGISAHMADRFSPGPLWYALTTGLAHLAVYLVPLLWALLVMHYAVSRRLAATGVVLMSVLVLAGISAVTNLEFIWPDATRQHASIGAGLGFSTSLSWLNRFSLHCLLVVGPAFAYRQWLVRRAGYTV